MTWTRPWPSSSAVRTAVKRRCPPRVAHRPAASATKLPRATSASTSAWPLPWRISPSADGKTASSESCTPRDAMPSSSTPKRKSWSSAGPKSTRENSEVPNTHVGRRCPHPPSRAELVRTAVHVGTAAPGCPAERDSAEIGEARRNLALTRQRQTPAKRWFFLKVDEPGRLSPINEKFELLSSSYRDPPAT